MRVSLLLAAVTFAAGACGLAYEQLYARLLSTYLGDLFYVDAAVLASFLGSIGIGALLSRRAPPLWLCELGAGLFAVGVAAMLTTPFMMRTIAPLGATNPALIIAVVIAFTAPPALLLGVAVPQLTALSSQSSSQSSSSQPQSSPSQFPGVYALYNVGAAACVVIVELLLLPRAGIRVTLLAVAAINFADAAVLWSTKRAVGANVGANVAGVVSGSVGRQREVIGLFVMSAISGLSQLFVLKIAEALIGPYHESFATLLCGNLVGIAIASWFVGRRRSRGNGQNQGPSFFVVCAVASVLASLALVVVGPAAAWCTIDPATGAGPSTSLRLLIALPLAILPAAGFGATVPALERQGHDGARLLFVSCAGNVAGYAAAVLLLWEHSSDAALAAIIPGVAAVVAVVCAPEKRRVVVAAVLAFAVVPSFLWPKDLLAAGEVALSSPQALTWVKTGGVETRVVRRLGTQAALVKDASGDETLVLDGYASMRITRGGRTNPAELLVGATPPTLAVHRDTALVLGLGTGISAGAVASLMGHTRIVELSPAMLALAPDLAAHSLGLFARDNVEIVEGDGLSTLAADTRRYDVILNTVNAPRFYASSKLYSSELLALARDHLTEGGVYAAWLDGSAGADSVDILARTLLDAFPHCAMVALKAGYAEVVCGNAPLRVHEAKWPREISEALAIEGVDANDLLRAIVFPSVRAPRGDRLHTLDRPLLEFTAAPLSGDALHGPWEALTPDVHVGGDGATVDDVAARCALLAHISRPVPAACR